MASPPTTTLAFDLGGPLPRGRVMLEASAGTGKTYSLTGLIVRFVAEHGITADQLLVVTFTRAAANELRERTRSALLLARGVLGTGVVPDEHPWTAVLATGTARDLAERARRLDDAVTRFDDATITTIHGFCQQALRQLGLRAGGDRDAVLVESTAEVVREVCRDLLVAVLIDDPGQLTPPGTSRTIGTVEETLVATVNAVLANPGASLVPDSDDATLAGRWASLVDEAVVRVRSRQAQRGEIGYDRLIIGLRDALCAPDSGDDVAAQLADRYRVVLVDEFQDTDTVQWEIFRRAFGSGDLVTVGDPKQAIYRFRGADVHAYLAATERATVHSLGTNHRSDRDLLVGLGTLFRGATLGDERIRFHDVAAAPGAPDAALRPGRPVHIRWVPRHASLVNGSVKAGSSVVMRRVRNLVLDDLVARMSHLFEHGRIEAPDAPPRAVRPGDLAVLVPVHSDAANIVSRLSDAGIPAVHTRTGSVLATPAVTQWRLLLGALARPHHGPSLRAAALGWFLETPIHLLDGDDVAAQAVMTDLSERSAQMADRLRKIGFAAFHDELKTSSSVLDVVLRRTDGDRMMTDLDHVAEVLAGALHGTAAGPARVLRTLEQLVADDDQRSDALMRRIDSDARAVQVTTIHASKGLEYPVVFVPFSFKPPRSGEKPLLYSDGGRRTIDVASIVPWVAEGDGSSAHTQKARQELTDRDIDGDCMRLLYVALTRARHHVELWWAPAVGTRRAALTRLLFDRDGAGPVLDSNAATVDITDDTVRDTLGALAGASRGTIDVTEVPDRVTADRWHRDADDTGTDLACADPGDRAPLGDRSWRRWSFTSIIHQAEAGESLPHPEPAAPIHGGTDEPAAASDGDGGETATAAPPPERVAPLAGVVAGTTFGTFVHSVLEHLDTTTPDLHRAISDLVSAHQRRAGLELDHAAVTDGLELAVRTPLGPLFGDRSLSDIPPGDRLTELWFDLPIVRACGRAPAGAVAEILLTTLPADDPLRDYASRLRAVLADLDLSGWLQGSIDAVFRVHDPGGVPRFVVVDYKSNRLHEPGAADPVEAYRPDRLVRAMEAHHYPVQALLYTVAVHRYLRWRIPGYDPDLHLGGAAYLFVRGMVGPSTPTLAGVAHGVFSWRPPSSTVLALDDLLAKGSPQ
jgi:exodeoxyribonuclease V beta subunit